MMYSIDSRLHQLRTSPQKPPSKHLMMQSHTRIVVSGTH